MLPQLVEFSDVDYHPAAGDMRIQAMISNHRPGIFILTRAPRPENACLLGPRRNAVDEHIHSVAYYRATPAANAYTADLGGLFRRRVGDALYGVRG